MYQKMLLPDCKMIGGMKPFQICNKIVIKTVEEKAEARAFNLAESYSSTVISSGLVSLQTHHESKNTQGNKLKKRRRNTIGQSQGR